MRKMLIVEGAALVILALAAVLFLAVPGRAQMMVYPLVRQAAQLKLEYETRDMLAYETEHFTIKYTAADAGSVPMVAAAAERAYGPVTAALDFAPPGKQLVVLYATRRDLGQVFGWSGAQSAMGVYWGGVIQVLSPQVWLKDGSAAEFVRSGPMTHEFTHLVLDYRTNGNYPRWFTEGLAQYLEYRVNGYEWRTADNSLRGGTYALAELDNSFDSLPNQALAYRESLAAVRYLAEGQGQDRLPVVLAGLEAGRDIKAAINCATGLSYAEFDAAWRAWMTANMIDG